MTITTDLQRGARVARRLYECFQQREIFGHGDDMPESMVWGDRDRHSLQHILFLTFTVAIDYMRDAHSLWRSALIALDDPETSYLFDPARLARMTDDQVLASMEKHELIGRSGKRDAKFWRTIGTTLWGEYRGDPRVFMADCDWDAPTILRRLRHDRHPAGSDTAYDFPLLRGKKIGPLWLRIMRDNAEMTQIKNMDNVPLPVDVHTARATLTTGVIRGTYSGTLSGLFQPIRDAWSAAVRDLHAGSKSMIALDIDAPLWTLSKYGCSPWRWDDGICAGASRCPVSDLCVKGHVKIDSSNNHVSIQTSPPFEEDSQERAPVMSTDATTAITRNFGETGSPAPIPNLIGGFFTATLRPDGVEVDNLGKQPFLPWAVFQETVCLLIRQGGRARKGNAMGPKLGEPGLALDSIEGHVAHVVYGKRPGVSVFRRIAPIACILIWAGVCENGRGFLLLNGVD